MFDFAQNASLHDWLPQSYLAGRLNDEPRIKLVDKEIKRGDEGRSKNDNRPAYECWLAYLVGLVTDLSSAATHYGKFLKA